MHKKGFAGREDGSDYSVERKFEGARPDSRSTEGRLWQLPRSITGEAYGQVAGVKMRETGDSICGDTQEVRDAVGE